MDARIVGVDLAGHASIVIDFSDGRSLEYTVAQIQTLTPVSITRNDGSSVEECMPPLAVA